MSAQTWRVVLASGEVREVVVRAGHSFTDGVGYFARLSPTDTMAFGADPRGAVLRLAVARYLDVAEILAPGEPSRAELRAERDEAWTAGAEAMRRGVDSAVADAAAWADYRSQQHASPDDDEDATHAQAHALDAVLARIRALTVPTRPEVSRG